MRSIIKDNVLYFEFSGEFDNVQVHRIRSCVSAKNSPLIINTTYTRCRQSYTRIYFKCTS